MKAEAVLSRRATRFSALPHKKHFTTKITEITRTFHGVARYLDTHQQGDIHCWSNTLFFFAVFVFFVV
ncbi:MAG: hypothetical protein A3K04_10825 [Gallionellales bacterium RBG_16_56_9]|nr:MAG: hypothetical protein A3K04_10825 [Gallionellales bacterium RBG_16_56_9]